MKRHRITSGLYLLCCVSVAGMPRTVTPQEIDCGQLNAYVLVQGEDTAYAAAQALAHELRRHGFTVNCILRSHSESLFDGQAGAGLFQTDEGNFDALFMPPTETFDRLRVAERREGVGYVYSFEGEPKPWAANRMESSQRMYFVKDSHRLLIIWGDEKLAQRLRRALTTGQ